MMRRLVLALALVSWLSQHAAVFGQTASPQPARGVGQGPGGSVLSPWNFRLFDPSSIQSGTTFSPLVVELLHGVTEDSNYTGQAGSIAYCVATRGISFYRNTTTHPLKCDQYGNLNATVRQQANTEFRTREIPSSPNRQSALTTTVMVVAASTATLTWYHCVNPNTAIAYVQIFDTNATVTLGTTLPTISLPLPASGGAAVGGLLLRFTDGVRVAATTTATGNTAPTTALDCNFATR